MTYDKAKLILRQCRFFYITGFILLLGMKLFYSQADSHDLEWILAPTARWVQILTGIPFEKNEQLGYISHSIRFIIAPSCSGVQFMLVVYATCLYSFIHLLNTRRLKLLWMGLCLIFSYLFTIFVNGIRITLAIYIPDWLNAVCSSDIYQGWLTPESLHTGIGTIVYFVSIFVAYRLAQFALHLLELSKPYIQTGNKYTFPAFWYFFIVLGIPLLNRIRTGNLTGYGAYALFIICICLPILLFLRLSDYCFTNLSIHRKTHMDNTHQ